MQEHLPPGVLNAAGGLWESLLEEVEVRCRHSEDRLRGEFEAQFDHFSSGLDGVSQRLKSFRLEFRAEHQALHENLGARLEHLEVYRGRGVEQRRCGVEGGDCPEQLMPHLAIEAAHQQDQCLSELRDLCENGLASLSARLDIAFEGIDHSDAASISDVERICYNRAAATEKSLHGLSSREQELQRQVQALEQRVPTQIVREHQQDELRKCKDQLLNLSMRVSELGMSSDREAVQSLSDECRERFRKQMEATQRLDGMCKTTLQKGHAAFQKLSNSQSQSEQCIAVLQRLLQADLMNHVSQSSELLDQPHRNHVPVNTEQSNNSSGTPARGPPQADDGCPTQ